VIEEQITIKSQQNVPVKRSKSWNTNSVPESDGVCT